MIKKNKVKTLIPRPFENTMLVNLLILKANKPDTYEYILKLESKKANALMNYLMDINGSGIKTLTVQQCKQIVPTSTINNRQIIMQYVENSDELIKNADSVKLLSQELSRQKLTDTLTGFRAEKDTGMFHCIHIDKKTALETKIAILKHFNNARKIKVHTTIGQYNTNRDKKSAY